MLEYLLDRGITKINYILVSHFDSDHCYNFLEILQKLKVENVIISKQIKETELFNEFVNLCKENNLNMIIVTANQEIQIEKNVSLKILWPMNIEKINSINNNSIVAKFEYYNFSMLFTGDIEKEVESELTDIYTQRDLHSTILKIAHHGSNTSSSEPFIEKVSPQIAVMGVGKNNKFGHPSTETLQRLNKLNVKTFRTDVNGEITIKVNKKGKIKINCINM